MTIRLGKRAEGPLPRMRRERVDLTIRLGKDYTYSATFTVYDIDTYDVVLGKPWLADLNLRHEIDHKKNRMWIWNTPEEKRRNRACRHTLSGLRPWEGKGRRETIQAMAKEQRLNLVWMDELWEECPIKLKNGRGESDDRRLAKWIDEVGIRLEVRMVSHQTTSHETTSHDATEPHSSGDPEGRATSILNEYQDIFAAPTGLPPESREKYQIVTDPNAKAPFKNPYRISRKEEEELRSQIEAALKNGWLTESTSEYGAPVIFIPKKDGTLRMCIDYRDLNRITTKDRFPLPSTEDLIDKLQGAKVFSKIDMYAGYNQMAVRPEDTHKMAFVTKFGLYEWRVLPFGLANGPAAFMRMMDRILASNPELRDFIIVYMDDVMIYSKSTEDHETHLRKCLGVCRQEGLKLKRSKCVFFRDAIEFVGFWVDKDGLHTEASKVEAVREWPRPRSGKEVLGFLGLTGFYRKFIERYAHKALPLYKISQLRGSQFQTAWNPDCDEAFRTLKEAIATAPALALPQNPGGGWILRTDASQAAIAGVLLQRQNHEESRKPMERVIGYFSRKLSGAETRYPTYDRELLAIRESILHWRYCLHGESFVCYTDHAALQRILLQQSLSTRQITYLQVLHAFDFTIKYWPGARNVIADTLSRRPDYSQKKGQETLKSTEKETDKEEEVELTAAAIDMMVTGQEEWLHVVREQYEEDETFGELVQALKEKEKCKMIGEWEKRVGKKLVDKARRYSWRDGLLWYRDERDRELGEEEQRTELLCVPKGGGLRTALFREAHDSLTAGHFGADKTYNFLHERYYWPRMKVSVKRYL